MFQYEFMQHALIAVVLAGLIAGLIGYLTLLRRLAFAAHGLGHISFTGATLALLLQTSPILGQFAATLCAGLMMGFLGENLQKRDMAVAMVLSLMLGLGMLFLHYETQSANAATALLFGNILGVSPIEIKSMAAAAILILLILLCVLRPLVFASIAPAWSEARGVPNRALGILFMLLLALAVTLVSQIVGALLVFTLLIGPAAISMHLVHRFWPGLILSMTLAVAFSIGALILSFYSNWPVSVWLTLLIFMGYGLVYGVKK